MLPRRLLLGLLAPALLVGPSVALLAGSAPPAFLPAAPLEKDTVESPAAFGAPTFRLVDSRSHGSELNLGWAPNGDIWVGGWDHLARSSDDGLSWTAITPKLVPVGGLSLGFAADRVLVVDHDTGRVMVADTVLAGCSLVAFSDDRGATWTTSPACTTGATDHEKVAFGKRTALQDPTGGLLYRNVMYMCANGLASTNCAASVDGVSFAPVTPHGDLCAFQGAPVADAAGVLYEPTVACGAHVRSTADNGQSWLEQEVTVNGQSIAVSGDTPDLGVTDDGALYFVYTDRDWMPAFVRSSDGGATWSGPFEVRVPGLTGAVFPVIVGGAPGKVALAFYGTTTERGGWGGNPGDAPAGVAWDGYVAVVTDADAPAPTIAPVKVTSDPLQYGCLSKLGGCLNNIADYMDIDVGPDGRVAAVFVDGCPVGCTSKSASTDDRGVVAVQTGGPRLR